MVGTSEETLKSVQGVSCVYRIYGASSSGIFRGVFAN